MKRITTFFVLCTMIFINIMALSATEVATIADAKKLDSGTKFTFTGELTLQYVTASANYYFAFDENNDFVRLCDYSSWVSLVSPLKEGDKIKVTEQITYISDADNCVTFELDAVAVKSIICMGSSAKQEATDVTIQELKADVDKMYSAKYVVLKGVKVESVTDFTISPFPRTKIVDGEESIDFAMELVETNFPSIADVYGFVDYSAGNPKLFIPNSNYVKASAFDNIAGLKTLTNQDGHNDIILGARVLVTYVKEDSDNYIYFAQQDGADGNPSAIQMVVPKVLNLIYNAGDSVEFNVVGRYEPVYFEVGKSSFDKLKSATYIVEIDNGSALISSNNAIETLVFDDVLADNGWVKYDNCLAITLKGDVVVTDAYSAIGCIGLKLKNVITNSDDIILVPNTYYVEAGSPTTAIVCGFVCGYKVGEESYAVLMPRSKNDFLPEVMEFDNIAALKAAGRTPSRAISYKLNNSVVITGFTSENYSDTKKTFYRIFVQDSTGAIQLNHESSQLQKKYKVGDVISGVVGYFMLGSSSYVEDAAIYFASASAIDLQVENIVLSTEQNSITPIEISISDLDDSYASQLITIKNVNYNASYKINLNGEEVEKPVIYQEEFWVIVDENFEYFSEMESVTGVYYLSGVMTKLIPRSQEDIIVDDSQFIGVENIEVDNNLFIDNEVVYAKGASIEVYDVMGRLIVAGLDCVDVRNINELLVIVKTKYDDNSCFVTKLMNK